MGSLFARRRLFTVQGVHAESNLATIGTQHSVDLFVNYYFKAEAGLSSRHCVERRNKVGCV